MHLRFARPLLTAIAILLLSGGISAQAVKKTLEAVRVKEVITLDANLDEPCWKNAPKASGFIQNTPYPGAPSAKQDEISILYDDNAIYIGACLYDTHPDSILKQLSPRDEFDIDNTDVFGVAFDTYCDQQNAFQFVVTAAGVQADAKIKFDAADYSWNAAWYSKVRITDKGWCVEMRIPYSALRFPNTAIQNWGINFYRSIRRTREKSYWNPVLPNITNFVGQMGTLTGIHDIISPIRLAFLPYLSTYAENYSGTTTKTVNGGMDIKYGLNESFTLDMTLVPDFGQTIYDNKVLNLSPIEVRYDDRRYFFPEGTDLFNKNDLFYSRRVGGTPVNFSNLALDSNEVVTKNPTTTRLYNATKISGRTSGNLGIGFFNATSAPAYATVHDTITGKDRLVESAPLTNYNVIVLDQALKNHSYISFINTNVLRKENSYNADVSALLFRFANKANTYAFDGSTDVSQIFVSPGTDVGYRYLLEGGKTSGNYTWTLHTRTISDRFNPNDLGYLDRNNLTYYSLDQNYNIYKPFGSFNSFYNHFGIAYYRIFNPDVYNSLDFNGNHGGTLTNYLSTGFYYDIVPITSYDYLEPRTFGRYYVYPQNYMIGAYFSSDYRKKFALDGETNYRTFSAAGRNTFYWSLSPRYRFSDKLAMVYSIQYTLQRNDVGYVDNVGGDIYFGTRRVNTLVNTLDVSYIFNSTMSLKLDVRHYWSQARYSSYSFLNTNGELEATAYNTSHDINFNSFNAYLSYIWQFRPGSEMSIVYQNSIYPVSQPITYSYGNDLQNTLQAPQSNSLSVKVIYYLDYLSL